MAHRMADEDARAHVGFAADPLEVDFLGFGHDGGVDEHEADALDGGVEVFVHGKGGDSGRCGSNVRLPIRLCVGAEVCFLAEDGDEEGDELFARPLHVEFYGHCG